MGPETGLGFRRQNSLPNTQACMFIFMLLPCILTNQCLLLNQQIHRKYYKIDIKIKIVATCFGVVMPSSGNSQFVL